jgi:hypothetical protein
VQVIVALPTWVVHDEGVDTGHPKGRMQDDLVVGSSWHHVVCTAQDHDLRAVGVERPLRFEPDPHHPTGQTAVVADVAAHYPWAMGVNDPDGHTLLSVGLVRFWVPGHVQGPRVVGVVSLVYDHDFPVEHHGWSRIGPPPHGREMRGMVRRIRRVPVYMAPPRPGSAEYGHAAGVRAGLGAPYDVPSALARVEAKQPEGFALPLDRPEPDAGTDGSWCNPEAGGFWSSLECLVNLELWNAPVEPATGRRGRARARSR